MKPFKGPLNVNSPVPLCSGAHPIMHRGSGVSQGGTLLCQNLRYYSRSCDPYNDASLMVEKPRNWPMCI